MAESVNRSLSAVTEGHYNRTASKATVGDHSISHHSHNPQDNSNRNRKHIQQSTELRAAKNKRSTTKEINAHTLVNRQQTGASNRTRATKDTGRLTTRKTATPTVESSERIVRAVTASPKHLKRKHQSELIATSRSDSNERVAEISGRGRSRSNSSNSNSSSSGACIANRTRSKSSSTNSLPTKRKRTTAIATSASALGDNKQKNPTLGANLGKQAHSSESSSSGRGHSNRRTHIASSDSQTQAATATSFESSKSPSSTASSFATSLLRRSSRSKGPQSTVTTGSCVSSAASTSQACAPYQIRGSSATATVTHSVGASGGSSAPPSGNNNSKSAHKHGRNLSEHYLTEPSTSQSVMADDGSRDVDAHNYGKYNSQNSPAAVSLIRPLTTVISLTELPPPSLRRSPRGNVKGGSSSAPASASAPSTSANTLTWNQQGAMVHSAPPRSSSTRAGSFFTTSVLDTSFSLSAHQPSTSQGTGLGAILSAGQANVGSASNPTVKLNKSILASSALAAASTVSENSVNVVNLVQGGGQSSGSSSGSALQGFSSSTGQASADPDTDDADVGRLQALLEARGIPPHVFGSLGIFT